MKKQISLAVFGKRRLEDWNAFTYEKKNPHLRATCNIKNQNLELNEISERGRPHIGTLLQEKSVCAQTQVSNQISLKFQSKFQSSLTSISHKANWYVIF